jgi:sulfur-carrier protein
MTTWHDGEMAVLLLRAPLSEMAGAREHRLEGETVRDVLRSLEQTCPGVGGWVLDERGRVREHINVFVNGERAREETTVSPDDRLHVLPSITGG